MPAAYRIVTRIQDQDDYSGLPADGEYIVWVAANNRFEPLPLSLGTLATQNGTFSGGGTFASGGFTLTVPATGTAALRDVSNTFTAAQLLPDGTAAAPTLARASMPSWGIYFAAAGPAIAIAGVRRYTFSNDALTYERDDAKIIMGIGGDLTFGRAAAASFQLGVDAAAPVAQTLKAHNGSGSNIAGAALTIAGGIGTGSGVGGSLIFQTAAAGGAGSSLNSLTTRLTIDNAGLITVPTGGRILIPDGTSGTPSIAFANATWMGIYRNGNDLGFSHNGFDWMYYSYSTPLKLSAVIGFGWSNITGAQGTADVVMGRDGSGYFNILKDSALTNATALYTFRHNSSGTPAVGFGTDIRFQGKSSTTADQNMLGMVLTWATATHASRKARTVFNVYDTAAREALRLEASGSAAMIGFLGAAAVVRPAAYTPTNVSSDRSFDADTVLVAELADVVGTLIADLQAYGLLA